MNDTIEPPNLELAALYRRVSTDHQDNSMELQEALNAEYCRRIGLAPQAYEDPDVSGSVWFNDRTGGHALLARLQAGGIKHLVTAKQDRLGRDTLDTIATIRKVWELGIIPHFTSEGGAFPRTPQNELLFEIKASVAQYERNLIRDRTRAIMRHKFNQGQLTGNVPFGFDCLYTFADGSMETSPRALAAADLPGKPVSKQLIDNLPEQATIRQMHAWRSSGWKLEAIADELNRRGIASKIPAGTPLKYTDPRTKLSHTIIAAGKWQAGNVAGVLTSRHTAKVLASDPSEEQPA